MSFVQAVANHGVENLIETPVLSVEQGASNIKIQSEHGIAAALETKRLSEKHGKDFFDCDDLVGIMGIGKNNARQLMCSDDFPFIQIGNRKVISVAAFAFWPLKIRQDNFIC
jgi:predicted flap endonuclease-1-like 5' DNA nuclease